MLSMSLKRNKKRVKTRRATESTICEATRRATESTVCEATSGGRTKRDAAGQLQQRQHLERPLERQEKLVQEKPGKEELDQEEMPPCWICLCEEPDECGKPPERDCSCRGHSGFAHASCIIEYAKTKSKEAGEYDVIEFVDPWRICPNCKQSYQRELAIDLADSCLSFVDDTHPEKRGLDQMRMVHALAFKMNVINTMYYKGKPEVREEGRKTAHQILTAIKHTQEYESEMTDDKLFAYDCLVMTYKQINAYDHLAFYALMDGTEQGAKEAIQYYEKKRACYESVGDLMGVKSVEAKIGAIRAEYFGDGDNKEYEKLRNIQYQYELKRYREQYESSCQEVGKNARVEFGTLLAQTLMNLNRCIEGERLMEGLATFSRRVHGPEHSQTRKMESIVNTCKQRIVFAWFMGSKGDKFEALRYEDGGDKIVIRGPFTDFSKRNIVEETTFTVQNDCIVPIDGTPVICHGLKNVTHLNGKLGDLRMYHEDRDRYEVHFEDKSLTPAFVRTENLRIAFDLTDAAE